MKSPVGLLRLVSPDVYPAPNLKHPDAQLKRAGFLLSAYLRMIGLLTILLSLCIIGLVSLSSGQDAVPDPLIVYHNLLPGHSRADAMSLGASCTQSTGPEPGDSCILSPAGGSFKTIKMVLLGGQITSVNFTVRANGLLVGDLERIWGKPTARPTARDGVVLLRWPEFHISATAHQDGYGHYSVLFLSVSLILINQ